MTRSKRHVLIDMPLSPQLPPCRTDRERAQRRVEPRHVGEQQLDRRARVGRGHRITGLDRLAEDRALVRVQPAARSRPPSPRRSRRPPWGWSSAAVGPRAPPCLPPGRGGTMPAAPRCSPRHSAAPTVPRRQRPRPHGCTKGQVTLGELPAHPPARQQVVAGHARIPVLHQLARLPALQPRHPRVLRRRRHLLADDSPDPPRRRLVEPHRRLHPRHEHILVAAAALGDHRADLPQQQPDTDDDRGELPDGTHAIGPSYLRSRVRPASCSSSPRATDRALPARSTLPRARRGLRRSRSWPAFRAIADHLTIAGPRRARLDGLDEREWEAHFARFEPLPTTSVSRWPCATTAISSAPTTPLSATAAASSSASCAIATAACWTSAPRGPAPRPGAVAGTAASRSRAACAR